MTVNFRRQCPTCRANVRDTETLPHLQNSIDNLIRPLLSEEDFQERDRVRVERQTQLTSIVAERQQTQALLALISSSTAFRSTTSPGLPLNQERIDNELGAGSVTRHILDWWSERQSDRRSRDSANLSSPSEEDLPSNTWYRRRIRSRLRADGERFRDSLSSRTSEGRSTSNRISTPSDSAPTIMNHPRSIVSEFERVYMENLMEEYNFHLERSTVAYSRIREGYRDFNYHNARMQQTLDEYQSFLATSSSNNSTNNANFSDPNNNLSYEAYENLRGAELSELINTTAAANILLGGLGSEVVRRGEYGTFRSGMRLLESRNQVRNELPRGERDPYFLSSSRFQRDSAAVPDRSTSPTTMVLDMEQEIRNRRSQLDRMSARLRLRQQNVAVANSAGRTTRRQESSPNRFMSRRITVSRPASAVTREARTELIRPRPCSAQHQLVTERSQIQDNPTPTPNNVVNNDDITEENH